MRKRMDPLAGVRVASPCSADWELMIGNDRRRFCGQCELNVYNLSDMTTSEAVDLINRTEGRLCVRFYRRQDGTILTRDCPVGLRALKLRVSRVKRAVITGALSFLVGMGFNSLAGLINPEVSSVELPQRKVMGVMAEPALAQPPYTPAEVLGGLSSSELPKPKTVRVKRRR